MEKAISKVGMPYLRLGSGEPLILIHGLGEIKEGWEKQFELQDQCELIIPDLRGHGENEIIEEISLTNFASDVIALLDELNIENAHICGLSMGGIVTQEIYNLAPEKCKSIILTNTFHFAPKFLENNIIFQTRKARAQFLSPQQQRLISAKTCLYSWKKETVEEFLQFYKPNKTGYLKSMDAVLGFDNRALLPNIKVPVLILGCQYDTVTPIWLQILMHKLIPHSELVIFKNAGHIAKFEAAEEFNQTLRFFINKHQQYIEVYQ